MTPFGGFRREPQEQVLEDGHLVGSLQKKCFRNLWAQAGPHRGPWRRALVSAQSASLLVRTLCRSPRRCWGFREVKMAGQNRFRPSSNRGFRDFSFGFVLLTRTPGRVPGQKPLDPVGPVATIRVLCGSFVLLIGEDEQNCCLTNPDASCNNPYGHRSQPMAPFWGG